MSSETFYKALHTPNHVARASGIVLRVARRLDAELVGHVGLGAAVTGFGLTNPFSLNKFFR